MDNIYLEVSPNPFARQAAVRFYLPQPGPATVNIFGLQGQLVRQLHDGHLDAGEYQRQWDGTDRNGNPLPSGVYLLQLRAEEEVVNKKVLLQH